MIQQTLKDTAGEVLNQNLSELETLYESLHLWGYAIPSQSNENKYYLDTDNSIAICGDWCFKPKAEGAFLSGYHLSHSLFSQQ